MKKIMLLALAALPLMAFSQLANYSRYDFIPGENILYANDFSQEVTGELPVNWITNNRGETVTIEKFSARWFRLFPGSRFTSPPVKKLPANFTMEADILMQYAGEGGYVYPELEIKLLELLPDEGSVTSYVVNQDALKEVALVLFSSGAGQPLTVSLKSYKEGAPHFSNEPKEIQAISENDKVLHLSVWVQNQRARFWMNSEKIFDIPIAVPAKAAFNRIGFSIESSIYTEEQLGVYISNIKLAEGTPDMRSKLITEGRLVTNGILFDVNSNRIKPESAGILKEIAAILKEDPSISIKIVGHTDSDGDEQKNLELSRQRSTAVQASLANDFGIDKNRLQTDGQGETVPLADNRTNEGKAKNRRVEFIKL